MRLLLRAQVKMGLRLPGAATGKAAMLLLTLMALLLAATGETYPRSMCAALHLTHVC